MKKTIYLLLVTLFLSILSFNTIAQEKNAVGGKELFEAVKTNNTARALELIKQRANLNYEADGDTTLTAAIRNRNTQMAKALLAAGANPNLKISTWGGTPLTMAVQMSNVELVELLIDKYKADVNPKSDSGYSILHCAADFNADERITALLLAAGSNPNVVNKDGQSPYELALSGKKFGIAKLLATVTNTKGKSSVSDKEVLGKELYTAADNGKTEIALSLIKRSADLNYQGEYGTPVNRAALNNNLPLVKALLEAGADPNASMPITNAIYKNNVEMVELFIKYKADVNAVAKSNGYAPLHFAAFFNTNEKITANLLAAGANPNLVTKMLETPFSIAVSNNRQGIINLLRKVTNPEEIKRATAVAAQQAAADSARQSAENPSGNLALGQQLYEAAHNNRTAVALDLIQQGADLNFQGQYGTPLIRAVFKNNLPLAKALLDAGADPNLSMPIHTAVYSGNGRAFDKI